MRVLEALGMQFETLSRQSYPMRGTYVDDLRYAMLRADREAWLGRPRHSPAAVELVAITPGDAHRWAALRTHHSQERFVSPMTNSFRDALFPEVVDGAPVVPWLRGVLADGEPAAFVMLADVTEHHPEPYLWRLLVDRMHQRRGIGGTVLAALRAQLSAAGHRSLLTSWVDGPGGPRRFYELLGFQPTGRVLDGEVEGRLNW
jgi:RimJ/RimL family protein N-acetyltransferase